MGMVIRKLVVMVSLFLTGRQQFPLTRIPQPANAIAAWNYDLQCTKLIGLQPTSNLGNVKWFKTKLPHDKHGYSIGEYVYPDTVIIDDRLTEQTELLAHELLHHLMYVDPRDDQHSEEHPFVPFYAPCKLMASQMVSFDSLTGVITFKSNGLKLSPRTP